MDNETVSERFRALLWGRLKPCWARRLRWAGAKTAGRKCWLGKETSEPCCRRTAASTSPSANVNLFFWPWPSTTGRVCEIRLGARRNSHVQATSLTEGGPRSRYGSSCSLPLTTSNRCCWSLSSPVVLCCSHSNSKNYSSQARDRSHQPPWIPHANFRIAARTADDSEGEETLTDAVC